MNRKKLNLSGSALSWVFVSSSLLKNQSIKNYLSAVLAKDYQDNSINEYSLQLALTNNISKASLLIFYAHPFRWFRLYAACAVLQN